MFPHSLNLYHHLKFVFSYISQNAPTYPSSLPSLVLRMRLNLLIFSCSCSRISFPVKKKWVAPLKRIMSCDCIALWSTMDTVTGGIYKFALFTVDFSPGWMLNVWDFTRKLWFWKQRWKPHSCWFVGILTLLDFSAVLCIELSMYLSKTCSYRQWIMWGLRKGIYKFQPGTLNEQIDLLRVDIQFMTVYRHAPFRDRYGGGLT